MRRDSDVCCILFEESLSNNIIVLLLRIGTGVLKDICDRFNIIFVNSIMVRLMIHLRVKRYSKT